MPCLQDYFDKNFPPDVNPEGRAATIVGREYAGNPTGNVTPRMIGELVWDSSGSTWYIAVGTASSNWAPVAISGLTAAELAYLDGITAGTGAASKALVLDASGNITIPGTLGVTGVATLTAAAVFTGGAASNGRLTTTDGVASGTARVIGGRAYAAVSASDNLLASAGGTNHNDFAQTYSIPANTLKASSVVDIEAMVRVTDASGTDTLECKLYIGGTTLLTSTAFDPDAAGDFVMMNFKIVSRAAPSAASSLTCHGGWVTSDGGVLARGEAILAPTNHATDGALIVKASAKWSATTANTNARLEVLNVNIV